MDSAQASPRGIPRRRQAVPSAVLAMLVFVICEAMFFAGLISSFTIVRANAMIGMWPPPGQPVLPASATAFNTAALIASGIAGVFLYRRFKAASTLGWQFWVTFLLGVEFVAFQGREWLALLSQGLTITSSQLGAFFYLVVGGHALHAVAALVALGMVWLRARRSALTNEVLLATLIFWWFVVALWPFLYLRVYF